jgi:hypothetical protein
MVEGGDEPGLGLLTFDVRLGVRRSGEHFDRDLPLQQAIGGLIDGRHPALAELPSDGVPLGKRCGDLMMQSFGHGDLSRTSGDDVSRRHHSGCRSRCSTSPARALFA